MSEIAHLREIFWAVFLSAILLHLGVVAQILRGNFPRKQALLLAVFVSSSSLFWVLSEAPFDMNSVPLNFVDIADRMLDLGPFEGLFWDHFLLVFTHKKMFFWVVSAVICRQIWALNWGWFVWRWASHEGASFAFLHALTFAATCGFSVVLDLCLLTLSLLFSRFEFWERVEMWLDGDSVAASLRSEFDRGFREGKAEGERDFERWKREESLRLAAEWLARQERFEASRVREGREKRPVKVDLGFDGELTDFDEETRP